MRMFEAKTEKVIGWKRLYKEELHNLYSRLDTSLLRTKC
jgi:hypothetical protein